MVFDNEVRLLEYEINEEAARLVRRGVNPWQAKTEAAKIVTNRRAKNANDGIVEKFFVAQDDYFRTFREP